ncbi:phage tail protein [Marinomonas posidonica]|uniref:phage tail protein n=1 Tax=Marinomonas posidonica TaxID=936476 RepID=UPI003736CAC9
MAVYFVGGAKLIKDIKSINAEIEILRSMEFGGVGRIEKYAASTPPQNTIKANGATLSRTVFWRLWEYAQASGNLVDQGSKQRGQFGTGDGSTTFTIPDLRGEFVRGLDDGIGIDAGREIGSWQNDAIRNITGSMSGANRGNFSGSSGAFIKGGNTGRARLDDGSYYSGGFSFDASRVVPTANENRPRNIALMFCIRYQ